MTPGGIIFPKGVTETATIESLTNWHLESTDTKHHQHERLGTRANRVEPANVLL